MLHIGYGFKILQLHKGLKVLHLQSSTIDGEHFESMFVQIFF